MKTKKIKFTGCEHLDYGDHYTAKKELIVTSGVTKVCWNRPVIDSSYPSLVQFCKKCGRLNNPEACLCEKYKMCNDYNEIEHIVDNFNLNETPNIK